jgi:hypothetical protein
MRLISLLVAMALIFPAQATEFTNVFTNNVAGDKLFVQDGDSFSYNVYGDPEFVGTVILERSKSSAGGPWETVVSTSWSNAGASGTVQADRDYYYRFRMTGHSTNVTDGVCRVRLGDEYASVPSNKELENLHGTDVAAIEEYGLSADNLRVTSGATVANLYVSSGASVVSLTVTAGASVSVSFGNVDPTPKQANFNTAFGGVPGPGFCSVVDPRQSHDKLYLVCSDGTNFHHVLLTKSQSP